MPSLHHRALCFALGCLLSASSAFAQKGGGKGGGASAPPPRSPSTTIDTTNSNNPRSNDPEFDPTKVTRVDNSVPRTANETPPCFKWPMSPIVSGTVSVTRLDVPTKARDAFNQGCEEVRKKNLAGAQQHLNQAVKLAPKFAVAWVLLGQAQEDQAQLEQAERSCTQARDADANYLGSYLCLARLAARQDKWERVTELTNHVIDLHPVRAPGAYYFNSLAYYNLKQFPLAEKSSLRAVEDSGREQIPEVHWLLAKIYEEKGDRESEADQLREYLKLAPHAADAAEVRSILAQIEDQLRRASSSNKSSPN